MAYDPSGTAGTARVFNGHALIERFQDRVVNVGIVFDMTASRADSIRKVLEDFSRQMDVLKQNSIGKLRVTLYSFGGNAVSFVGVFDDLSKIASHLENRDCKSGLTNISDSISQIIRDENSQTIPKLDALLTFGDTTDGERDNSENLERSAWDFGRPIISLLEWTQGNSGTQFDRDPPALKAMSEASGVQGCPITYSKDIRFVDYVNVIAAASIGPEAVKVLKASGTVPQNVWDHFPSVVVESISNNVADTPPSPEPHVRKPVSPWVVAANNTLSRLAVAGVLAVAIIGSNKDSVIKEPELPGTRVTIIPPTLDTREIADSFRQTGRFVFDDQRFREAFPRGETNFTSGFTTNLDILGKFLQDNPRACQKLVIEGHTDIRGTVSFNQRLSEERARTVANYLQQNFQISIPIETIGRGGSQLITRGATETDHAQNRRITVSGCEPVR